MAGYVIGTLAILAVVLGTLCRVVWYSRGRLGLAERLADGRPRQTGNWGWGWSFICLCMGMALIALGGSIIAQQVAFVRYASPVIEASIVDYRVVARGRSARHFRAVVSWTGAADRTITATALTDLDARPTIGSTTRVRYDSRDPTQVWLVAPGMDWARPIELAGMGGLFLAAAIGFSPSLQRRRARRRDARSRDAR